MISSIIASPAHNAIPKYTEELTLVKRAQTRVEREWWSNTKVSEQHHSEAETKEVLKSVYET